MLMRSVLEASIKEHYTITTDPKVSGTLGDVMKKVTSDYNTDGTLSHAISTINRPSEVPAQLRALANGSTLWHTVSISTLTVPKSIRHGEQSFPWSDSFSTESKGCNSLSAQATLLEAIISSSALPGWRAEQLSSYRQWKLVRIQPLDQRSRVVCHQPMRLLNFIYDLGERSVIAVIERVEVQA